MPPPPEPITFPVAFPDIPPFLFLINVPRKTAAEVLGPPMVTDIVDGLGDGDFWAFEYECGLQVVFQFMHHIDSGWVLADSPELDHVLRHIPFAKGDCVPIEEDVLESELKFLLSGCPERQKEIDQLQSFQVWRQGDDGNKFPIGNPTSERDARCWVQQFESLGHKQLYWYAEITNPQAS